ncbi:MAG: GNAT family N-acetyltransferase [Rhodospirillaceae bacterium]|nr:GNAT family N-acetyltransferase [Rhodospirillaceae bacterium]
MPEESISIQPFTPDMADRVGRLVVAIQRDEFKVPIGLDDQPDLIDIPGHYQKAAGGFWIAVTDDGRVVGSIGLLDIGGNLSALRKMFVAADYRGSEWGIAKSLLDALLAHARTQSLSAIYLGSTAVMARAHRFYEKNGFHKIDRADLPEQFPVMDVDSHFCRLKLNDS